MEIHKALLIGMNNKNIRQADIAKELNVTRGMVHRWVSGQASPVGENLVKLIDLLDIHALLFPDKFKEEEYATKSEVNALWEKIEKIEKQLDNSID